MSEVEHSASFLSLADLAQMDTSDVKELMSRLPDAGLFIVECKEVKLTVTPSTDPTKPAPMIRASHRLEIVAVDELVDRNKDPESLIGRNINDSMTLWANTKADFDECVGLLKGKYKKVRLANDGPLGGDGVTSGWLDLAVGHTFPVRVKHGKNQKTGDDTARVEWVPITDEMLAESA